MAAPITQLMAKSSITLILICVVSAAALGSELSWNRKEVTVRQGDSLNLTCSGGRLDELTDVRRLSVDRPDSNEQSAIADNSFLKPAYNKLKRLKLVFDGRKPSTTLIYTGIRGEDAGIYGCYSLSDVDQVATVKVNVLVPVDSVTLHRNFGKQGQELKPGEDLILVETPASNGSLGSGLECVATVDGSLTPPTVSVSLDSGEDVTDMFVRETNYQVKPRENYEDVGVYEAVTRMKYRALKPERKWNGRTLQCSTQMVGFNKVSASVRVIVQYAPVITCARTAHTAEVGSSVSLSCDVESNPVSQISWLHVQNQTSLLPINSSDARTSVKNVKGDTIRATLHIDDIKPSHYTTYQLSAINQLGSSAANMTLYTPGSVLADSAAYSNVNSGISVSVIQLFSRYHMLFLILTAAIV